MSTRQRRRIFLIKTFFYLSVGAFLVLAQSGNFINQSARAERGESISAKNHDAPRISPATLRLVKYFEGYTPICEDFLDGHATIGHGNLLHFGPCTASDNTLYVTPKEAEETLQSDLLLFQERVRDLVKVPISENMKSALISFSYNVGASALERSTLLSLLNAEDYKGAASQFDLWINGPSGPLPGLIKRRSIEKDLFLRGLSQFINKNSRD